MSDLPLLKLPYQTKDVKPVFVQGDTIPEILFTFAPTDDIDLTGSTIKIQIYNYKDKVLDLDSSVSGITIIDGKSFKIDKIEKENNDLPCGILHGDVEITDSSGDRDTYFNIELTISEDKTK